MNVQEIAYHRNGISGEPFYVVTFTDPDAVGEIPNAGGEMVAVVFDMDPGALAPYNPRTAVFDRELLGAGVIAFADNSWRGDHYDRELRQAIEAWERDSAERYMQEAHGAGVKP